jgi:hypothetical protein
MTALGSGEWSVYVGGIDCIVIEFNVVKDTGVECFTTTMPRADARGLAGALLRKVDEPHV